MSAMRDALIACDLSLTPMRMSDTLISSHPPVRMKFARKLTDDQVLDIRREFATGNVSAYELGNAHDIDPKAIYNIIDGLTYKEVS